MNKFLQKYYTREIGRKLKQMGIRSGLLHACMGGYYIPRPARIILIINALAEIHNLDKDDLLWECINSITGDKYE